MIQTKILSQPCLITRITLSCFPCRPKALNALNQAMCETLHRLYCDWEASPDVHAIILKGAGGKAFCAGGDVKGMVQLLLAGQHEKAIRLAAASASISLYSLGDALLT